MRKLSVCILIVILSSMFLVSVTAQTAPYDPYADYDADGDIDIFDVIPMADAYGTTGNPTRNVTVINWPSEWQFNITDWPTQQPEPAWKTLIIVQNLNVTWDTTQSQSWTYAPWTEGYAAITGGFNRMKLFINVINYSSVGGDFPTELNEATIQVAVSELYGGGAYHFVSPSVNWDTGTSLGQTLLGTYPSDTMRETQWPSIEISIRGGSRWGGDPIRPLPPSLTCLVTVGIYLRSE